MRVLGGRLVGGGFAGGLGGAVAGLLGIALFASGCGGDDRPNEPETLLPLRRVTPGDVVGLAADDARGVLSWLHRTDGTIHEVALDDEEPIVVATIDVGTTSQQGGLLDQALLPAGIRVLTWTTPHSNELVLGTLDPGADRPDIVWSAGEAGDGAIGGRLDVTDDGAVLLGLGRNTAWDAETDAGGAILRFPDGQLADEPIVLSTGYTNPWAIEAVATADPDDPGGPDAVWVWDNAAGPDPDDTAQDDVERIGRADLEADRNSMTRSTVPDRAPTAIVELPDGRLGVCGFLDNELRAYERSDDPASSELERAGTIMPCNAGAAVFADGTIVTAAQTVDGESLQILRP
ncbi:MAG: hypothetical protein AAFP84_05670 [Actinomycetota bacterium]